MVWSALDNRCSIAGLMPARSFKTVNNVLHVTPRVEKVLFSVVRVPGRLPTHETEVRTAVPLS